VSAFSRVYARAISGTPISMLFNPEERIFRLDWIVDESIELPTEVIVPEFHYPNGFNVVVTDGMSWTYSEEEPVLYIRVVALMNKHGSSFAAFVIIKPKLDL
jgi:Glycoside hydrolase family 5 C-terminal domain